MSSASASNSFLSQYVPSYLTNQFNLPQHLLSPFRHRSSYQRTYSLSPYIFSRLNWLVVALLGGGGVVSFLLYWVFGIVVNQRKRKRIGDGNHLRNERQGDGIGSLRDGTTRDTTTTTETGENYYQLPEMQPLMNRIDALMEKQRISQTDDRVRDYLSQQQQQQEDERRQSTLDQNQGNHETTNPARNATTTGNSYSSRNPNHMASHIPSEVYTRQLRNLISRHLDRIEETKRAAPVSSSASASYHQQQLQSRRNASEKDTFQEVQQRASPRQITSSFIQEYTEKEQQFMSYCEKLLKVVDGNNMGSSAASNRNAPQPKSGQLRQRNKRTSDTAAENRVERSKSQRKI